MLLLKDLLHVHAQGNFFATCNAVLMIVKHFKLLVDVRQLQLAMQLFVCADKTRYIRLSAQLFVAVRCKKNVVYVVDMLYAATGFTNVVKSRRLFNFFCNLLRSLSLCCKMRTETGVMCAVSATCFTLVLHCRFQRTLPQIN